MSTDFNVFYIVGKVKVLPLQNDHNHPDRTIQSKILPVKVYEFTLKIDVFLIFCVRLLTTVPHLAVALKS